jgi:hypothetical protein
MIMQLSLPAFFLKNLYHIDASHKYALYDGRHPKLRWQISSLKGKILHGYCNAPFFHIAWVCGVSPPPPLESRLQAGGVSVRHRFFFDLMAFSLSVTRLA